jgi:2'-deoxynucleoside 5'-phosphate N-hydrolase
MDLAAAAAAAPSTDPPEQGSQATKVYFAGSIRGGRQDAGLYAKLIAAIEAAEGHFSVLTEHVGAASLSSLGEQELSEQQIFDRDLGWLRSASLFVADVTTPSLGVGYEIAYASAVLRLPCLCLFRPVDPPNDSAASGSIEASEGGPERRSLSAMVRGCPDVDIEEYATAGEACSAICSWLVAQKRAPTGSAAGASLWPSGGNAPGIGASQRQHHFNFTGAPVLDASAARETVLSLSGAANLSGGTPVPDTFKVVVVGDGGVGKSQLLRQYAHVGEFDVKYIPTLGVEVRPVNVPTTADRTFTLNMWDIAGQEKFAGLRDGYYIGGHAGIICIDLSQQKFPSSYVSWRRDLFRTLPRLAPVIVVGLKGDLTDSESPAWWKKQCDLAAEQDGGLLDPRTPPQEQFEQGKRRVLFIDAPVSAKSQLNLYDPLVPLIRRLGKDSSLDVVAGVGPKAARVGH